MLALLTITALAIDLGAKRADKRTDQSVADLAAIAAGSFLAGNGSATVVSSPFAACKAAVVSAQMNLPGFNPTQDPNTTCAVFPTDAATGCSATTGPLDAVFSDTAHTLTVRYPIPDDELVDARFGGVGVNDGTDRCERMRITFSQTTPTAFARVIGVNDQFTTASATIRANTNQLGQGVAALLLLERISCGSLQNSGQGAILVRAPSATNPGVIQADSAGQVPPCTTNTNAGGYVVFGPSLPASAGGGPSISAETTSDGTLGIIGIFSLGLATPGRGGAVYPGGLSVAPVKSSIASRQAVDDKYNGDSLQITDLNSTAYTRTGWSNATATASGYALITGTGPCNGTGIPASTLIAMKVFVDCNTYQPDINLFPNATDFVVRGNIDLKVNKVLSLPAVRNFFVRGCAQGGCGGANKFSLKVAGELLVNTGEASLAAPDPFANGVGCASREGLGAGGSTTNWTQLAGLTGEISITGQARLCQTFIYMGQNTATYARQTVTATGVAPESYPAITDCSSTLPCPKDAVNDDWPFSVSGGGSATDWSAPNQLDRQPETADFALYPFEDLALWSETSSTGVALKGQAGNETEGVFFMPNASALFTGQGSQPIDLNAQFLIRRLNMSGQGSMTLSPSPADAVITPIPGALSLIR